MAENSDNRPISIIPATTISDSSFKSRYVLKLLASPASLVPILFGITDLLALWTFNIRSGAAAFAGLAGILGGLGIFLTRFLTGDAKTSESVVESLQNDAVKQREKALDDLDYRLCQDNDPRPEGLLRDLRVLAKLFEQDKVWTGPLKSGATMDILNGVDRMFKECVTYLEKTWELQNTADLISQAALKKPLLKQREQIIEDIAVSISHLGKILSDIKALERTSEGTKDSDLSRIREELDQSLVVAQKVSERMEALDRQIDGNV